MRWLSPSSFANPVSRLPVPHLPRVVASVVALLFVVPKHGWAANPFYDFKVVAQSGQNIGGFQIQGFGQNTSINEQNNIAFIGVNGGSKAIFFSQGGASPTLVAQGNFLSVWLNNLDQIATVFSATASGDHVAVVKRYQFENGTWTYTNVAKASTAMRSVFYNPCAPFAGCSFTIKTRVEPFDDILPEISMNDAGWVTFTGVLGDRDYLTVQNSYRSDIGPALIVSSTPQPAWRPVIDNRNHVLIRAGNLFTSPIRYYPSDFTGAGTESIATEAGGFSRIGRSPGVSDDGTVIAFYAELTVPGADLWTAANGSAVPIPLTPGPGIFASVRIGNARKLIRLAGVAGNDQLDPGERWFDEPDASGHHDRGQDFNFNQNADWEIGSFEPDFRIAVSGVTPFAVSTNGSFVTVTFIGTNTNEERTAVQKKAMFSNRLNLFRDAIGNFKTAGAEAPILVAEGTDALTTIDANAVNKAGNILFRQKATAASSITFAKRKSNSDSVPGLETPRFDPDSPVTSAL